MTPLLA